MVIVSSEKLSNTFFAQLPAKSMEKMHTGNNSHDGVEWGGSLGKTVIKGDRGGGDVFGAEKMLNCIIFFV